MNELIVHRPTISNLPTIHSLLTARYNINPGRLNGCYLVVQMTTSNAQPDNVSQDEKESVLCRHAEVLPGNSNLQHVLHYLLSFIHPSGREKSNREERKYNSNKNILNYDAIQRCRSAH